MLDNLLIMKCTIQTRDPSENNFGEKTYTYTDTYTGVLCRFSSPKGHKIRLDSGEFVEDTPKMFLKADQDISENCRIVGTTGFTETYSVLKVNKQYDTNGIHHKELILEKTI